MLFIKGLKDQENPSPTNGKKNKDSDFDPISNKHGEARDKTQADPENSVSENDDDFDDKYIHLSKYFF